MRIFWHNGKCIKMHFVTKYIMTQQTSTYSLHKIFMGGKQGFIEKQWKYSTCIDSVKWRNTYFKLPFTGSSVSKITAIGIDVGSFQYAVSRSSRVSNIMKLIGWSPGSRCIVNHSWFTLSRKCCDRNTIISKTANLH